MSTIAMIGQGLQLKWVTGDSPGAYENLGELREWGGYKSSADELDATHHGSEDAHREKILGVINPGDIAVVLAYQPSAEPTSSHAKLMAAHQARELHEFVAIYPDGTTNFRFFALVKDVGEEYPLDAIITLNVTLTLSGKPGIAAAVA